MCGLNVEGVKAAHKKTKAAIDEHRGALVVVFPGYASDDLTVTSKARMARMAGLLVWTPTPPLPTRPTREKSTTMNDRERFLALAASSPWANVDELQRIVDKNQNAPPGGGADGSFTSWQWTAARDFAAGIRKAVFALETLRRTNAPPAPDPTIPPPMKGKASLSSPTTPMPTTVLIADALSTFDDDDLPF